MAERTTVWGARLLARLRRHKAASQEATYPGERLDAGLRDGIRELERRVGAELALPDGDSALERVAGAVGRALVGRRAAVLLHDGEALEAALPAAARRLAPLVVWAEVSSLPRPGALPEGMPVLVAGSEPEALDLGLVARMTAEAALCPVLVLVPPPGAPSQALSLPEPELLASLLGRASDEIEAPTAAQRALFGPTRARVPRWFDLERPLGLPAAPAEVASAARHHLLVEAREALLAEAREKLGSLTGRSLPGVELTGRPGADLLVLGAGVLGKAAAMAAGGRKSTRAGRILQLAPIPNAELVELARDVRRVLLVQDGPDEGPGSLATTLRSTLGRRASFRFAWLAEAAPAAAIERLGELIEQAAADALPGRTRLHPAAPQEQTGFPRRDAAVQELREAGSALWNDAFAGVDAPERPQPAAEPPLPALLRRIPSERRDPSSLPRFWGEVVQPAQAGLDPGPSVLLATGVVPAGATGLQSSHSSDRSLPELDPARCTGCGACWAACPDSAVGATALPVQALLDAAARAAGTKGKDADALRRAHKHLARTVADALLSSEGAPVPPALWADAFEETAGRLGLSAEAKAAQGEAWAATAEQLNSLRPLRTAPLFDGVEARAAGSGALLVLGFDPDACTGCGLCTTACADGALEDRERTPERLERARSDRARRDELPDTPGDLIALLEEQGALDPVRALLLARGAAQAQVGGGGGEPGSGRRLAARLVAAFAEERGGRSQLELLRRAESARRDLDGRLSAVLAASTAEADPAALARVAAGSRGKSLDLEALGARLRAGGERAGVDREALLHAAEAAASLDALAESLRVGVDGLGSARFAVLTVGSSPGELLGPLGHPWYAPAVGASADEAPALAAALATSLAELHLERVRSIRRAALSVENPRDLPGRLLELARLRWSELEEDERRGAPPLLVLLADDGACLPAGWEPLLCGDLPVKLVLLQGLPVPAERCEPGLVAPARRAYTVSVSPAFPGQLAAGLRGALGFAGPALLAVHAPEPRRLGIEPSETAAELLAAVSGRAFPLLRYDPSRSGLAERFDLAGNPEEDGDALPAAAAPADRAAWTARWRDLQQLAGAAGPLAETLRGEVAAELAEQHAAELARLRSEHEAALAAARGEAQQDLRARLVARLTQLSGSRPAETPEG